MTIHPVRSVHTLTHTPPQRADSLATDPAAEGDTSVADTSAVYDSTWASAGEAGSASSFETLMVSGGKIYVVLAVVLIIWLGLVVFLLRTDRKIHRLEEKLESRSETDE